MLNIFFGMSVCWWQNWYYLVLESMVSINFWLLCLITWGWISLFNFLPFIVSRLITFMGLVWSLGVSNSTSVLFDCRFCYISKGFRSLLSKGNECRSEVRVILLENFCWSKGLGLNYLGILSWGSRTIALSIYLA